MSNDSISDEDKALFRKEMNLVTPLQNKKRVVFTEKPNFIKRPRPSTEISAVPNRYSLSNAYAEPVASDTILSYMGHTIPRKRFKQLKQGSIAWEARLDLHGLNPDDANRTLCVFIEEQYRLQRRALLIIHGKGGRDGKAPIIKNLVNHWLKQFPEILAFHSALPRDGGSGALYVLLKRHF